MSGHAESPGMFQIGCGVALGIFMVLTVIVFFVWLFA